MDPDPDLSPETARARHVNLFMCDDAVKHWALSLAGHVAHELPHLPLGLF